MRWVIGYHACMEVLKIRSSKISKIVIGKNLKDELILKKLKKLNKKIIKDESFLKKLHPLHQNLALKVSEDPQFNWEKVKNKKKSLLIFLDSIKDPQNLGAMMRVAWLTGLVEAIFIPKKNKVNISPFISKASCGASEHIPLISCNLHEKLLFFKKHDYMVYSFISQKSESLIGHDFRSKKIFIFGSEDKGIKRLLLEKSDFNLHIPQIQKDASYNVSSSFSMALYELLRKS